jgi:hypothetical protein
LYTVRRWSLSGFIEKIHNILRDRLRRTVERNKSPSTAIIDSQSAKTTEQGGSRGIENELSIDIKSEMVKSRKSVKTGSKSVSKKKKN